ncbi:hypothetical protein PIB30_055268 [Stylosanthes scabra]|uniref:Uncharacterized protein n=1 Tax=Stylosanthes scabra TaxID=79078 RepID=A0ABU6RJY6_9FABA|nr:hypothetical protein [Stylosanthes scabra]
MRKREVGEVPSLGCQSKLPRVSLTSKQCCAHTSHKLLLISQQIETAPMKTPIYSSHQKGIRTQRRPKAASIRANSVAIQFIATQGAQPAKHLGMSRKLVRMKSSQRRRRDRLEAESASLFLYEKKLGGNQHPQ